MSLLEKYYRTLVDGFNRQLAAGSEAEAQKLGYMRGGNSGCITDTGLILGSDPRSAVLRSHGIQTSPQFDDSLLFQAGHQNEEGIAEYLELAGIPHKREEECPVQWECKVTHEDAYQLYELGLIPKRELDQPLSAQVSGRPDFKLLQFADGQDVGIELKGIFGTGTLMDVANFLGGTPKVENVCQAAHYSWQNGCIPWILQYVNRSWHTVFYYGAKRFTEDHRAIRRDEKTGKPVVIGPFTSMYELQWEHGTLTIDGIPTFITTKGIERYYQYLTICSQLGIIPRAHDAVDIYGQALKKDKQANYYGFDKADTSSFEAWVQSCRTLTEET